MRSLMVFSAVSLFAAAAGAQERVFWRPCEPAAERTRCGVMPVPEDRARPESNTIEISFAVVAAAGPASNADPVVVLLGGPGDAPSKRLAGFARSHAALNATRDLILVDQRGTGASSPLSCFLGSDDDLQSYMNEFMPLAEVRNCLATLRDGADLSRYRTRDFVADLEDLRESLGVERWNLHGVSYGTRVALHYMARHPASVRSAVLIGVVPPELVMPVPFGEDADRALRMLIADCRADAACAAAFPRFAAEVDSVARRLARAPAETHVVHPVTGKRERVTLTRGTFGEVVRAMMYTPAAARALPLSIHEAYLGDHSAIAAAALRRQRGMARDGWAGLYLAVTCPEDVARADETATYARNRGTILGEFRARQHIGACEGWPLRPDGEEWPGGRIAPPVLMIVGDQDPVTPPRWAELAMRNAENGRLVVIPQGGHGFPGMSGGECLGALLRAFVDDPVPRELDVRCAGAMRRLPFVVRR